MIPMKVKLSPFLGSPKWYSYFLILKLYSTSSDWENTSPVKCTNTVISAGLFSSFLSTEIPFYLHIKLSECVGTAPYSALRQIYDILFGLFFFVQILTKFRLTISEITN
jgi:hypothetical protein